MCDVFPSLHLMYFSSIQCADQYYSCSSVHMFAQGSHIDLPRTFYNPIGLYTCWPTKVCNQHVVAAAAASLGTCSLHVATTVKSLPINKQLLVLQLQLFSTVTLRVYTECTVCKSSAHV
jgi:hypothetical protein